jgi:hypothetical protein
MNPDDFVYGNDWIYVRTNKIRGYYKHWMLYGLKRLFIFASITGALEYMTHIGYFVKIHRQYLLEHVREITDLRN